MLIDHVGHILFPQAYWMRVVGRLAFPIFAYMIAEGCRYTRNKLRYFLTIFIMAIAFQIVYFAFTSDMYMNILFTFSLAILIIYSLQYFKSNIINNAPPIKTILSGLLLVSVIFAVFILNAVLTIDYGFMGCLLPFFASIFHYSGTNETIKSTDNNFLSVTMFTIGLILLIMYNGGITQIFSLLSIPLLYLYSGQRGKYNMKYFFYIFYPTHLVILYIIKLII